MTISLGLSPSLYLCLSIHPRIYLPICLSIYLSIICMFLCIYLRIYLCTYLYLCICLYVSIRAPMCVSNFIQDVHMTQIPVFGDAVGIIGHPFVIDTAVASWLAGGRSGRTNHYNSSSRFCEHRREAPHASFVIHSFNMLPQIPKVRGPFGCSRSKPYAYHVSGRIGTKD